MDGLKKRGSNAPQTDQKSAAAALNDDAAMGSGLRFKIIGVLASRHWPLLAASLAVLLTLPSLWSGFFLDDFYGRLVIHQPAVYDEVLPHQLDIFNFADGDPEHIRRAQDVGMMPWWMDLHFKGAFWRPLAAVTHYADYQIWPHSPWLMHLHSVIWYALAVLAVALLFRRFMGATLAAGLAALMFAIDDAHGVPVGFLSNRNILIACVFGMMTLLAHHRWRRDGKPTAGLLAMPLYAGALLSAEAGLSTFAYLAAYAACLDRGTLRGRIISLAPYLALTVIWRVLWSSLGYGVHGITLYIDPLGQPLEFLAGVFHSVPLMVTSLLTPVPPEAQYIGSALLPWVWWIFAALGVAAVWAAWRMGRRDKVMLFFLLGALLSMLPSCATLPQNRVMVFPGIGGFALIGHWLATLRHRRKRSVTAGVAVWMLIGTHFVIAPAGLAFLSSMWLPPAMKHEVLTYFPEVEQTAGRDMIVVNHPLPAYQTYFLGDRAVNGQPLPARSRVLSQAHSPLIITRTAYNQLKVQCDFGFPSYLTGVLGRLARPFRAGDHLALEGMDIYILETDDEHMPTQASFVFDRDLDDDHLVWYSWADGRFQRFHPPAVGQSTTLPPAPAPLGMSPARLYDLVHGRLSSDSGVNRKMAGLPALVSKPN